MKSGQLYCEIRTNITLTFYNLFKQVKSVDCKAKTVTLQDSSSVSYDTLVVATGGK